MRAPVEDLKMAIVGAGVAGLTAAHRLREKGYDSITVYEREASVGGKVCSYSYQGNVYELGALWSSPRYKIIDRFASEVGAKRRGARLPDLLEDGVLQNYAGYMKSHFRPLELAKMFFHLGRSFVTYPSLRRANLGSLGFEASDSFERYSKAEGFGELASMAESFFAGCGYPHHDIVPAPYLMKMMHLFIDVLAVEVLALSRTRMKIFQNGWQDLWVKMARGFDVRHSSSITKIARYDQHGKPKTNVTVDGRVETYDRLILASPLDTCGLFVDLRDEERDLFSKIRTHRYKVTLVEAENVPHASMMDHVSTDKVGHINLIARQSLGTNVHTVYQRLDDQLSEERATALMHEDIRAMGGTLSKIITSKIWKYFPHVSTEDIRSGFYDKLERLQGKCGTFYVGSLMNMETVEHTAQFSIELIDRKF